MAMQSGIGFSKILILAGAGYTSTILLKNGKLSDLLGELQSLLNGSGEHTEGDYDSLTAQISRLTAEIRQIGSSRGGSTVFVNGNGSQIGNMTSLIMPAATLGAVGYGYMWWKGLKLSDIMYVTKRGMATAVENLTKNLDNVKEAVAKAKKHLTQRIQHVDDKMVEQNELSRSIKEDVAGVQHSLTDIDYDLSRLQSMVSGLDHKIGSLEHKQDLANLGVIYLVNFVDGKKVEMPKTLQKQLENPGKSRGRLLSYSDSSGLMGLKEIADSLSETLNPSTDAIVKDDIEMTGEYRKNNLIRSVSTRC
ncbi:hypothetical protein ACFX15_020524 [Malus domestica]|nr:uncharacterized protein LOC103402926 [Malus domestica]